jgi:hypothetical protein
MQTILSDPLLTILESPSGRAKLYLHFAQDGSPAGAQIALHGTRDDLQVSDHSDALNLFRILS